MSDASSSISQTSAAPVKNSAPWLTILIPTYNRASFVASTVEMVLNLIAQRGDIQLLISDNCSIDTTHETLAQLKDRHPALEVTRSPAFLPSAEENIAFALPSCRGERIWIIGDDDYVLPGAIGTIEALIAENDFDFFLFNTRLFYAPATLGMPIIPLVGPKLWCSIEEIISRVGLTTIAASISCVVMRTEPLRRILPAMIARSPFYAHVAAYLAAFKGGRCGFGDEPIVYVRDAATATITFGESIALGQVRSAGPWGFGIVSLIADLIERGAVADDFIAKVIELGHKERYGLLEYVLVHCIKQIRAYAESGKASEAVGEDELAALMAVTRNASPYAREIATRVADMARALAVLYGPGPRASNLAHELGPPVGYILKVAQPNGPALIEIVRRWIERESRALEAVVQSRLHLSKEIRSDHEIGDYLILRMGIDVVAVRRDIATQAFLFSDLLSVNPYPSPPHILIAPDLDTVKQQIEAVDAEPERFLTQHITGAAGLVIGQDEKGRLRAARSKAELRDKLANALVGRVKVSQGPAGGGTLASLLGQNAWLFDGPWYAGRYRVDPDVAAFASRARDHYLEHGHKAGWSPSIWFDESWYCVRWFGGSERVRAAGFSCGLHHFLAEGASMLMSPSPYIDLPYYLSTYPDVRYRLERGSSPDAFADYFLMGAKSNYALTRMFDETWYKRHNPDAEKEVNRGEFISMFHFFLLRGQGTDPCPSFSEAAYLAANRDVGDAVARGDTPSGFDHWIRHGRREGRHMGSFKRLDTTAMVVVG